MRDDLAEEALEIARLASLSSFNYDRERLAASRRLHVRLGTLDCRVKDLRPAPEASGGQSVTFPEVPLWDNPVAGGELLSTLSGVCRQHLILSQQAADALALWVLHTWVFNRFEHTPRLTVRSPVRRCGKSTLLELLRVLCRRPLKADSISAAGMFRTVEHLSPCTLLIDEADAFLADNEQLRGIMNSGFEQHGSVIRVVEVDGEQVPQVFRTFAPLAVAAIGKLPDTVEDRAVPILLERKAQSETIIKLRQPGARQKLMDLARMAARWAEDEVDQLSSDPHIPDQMGDREGDVCVPLLAIADNAGGGWPERARSALLELFGVRARDDGNADVLSLLLRDIRSIFNETAPSGPDARLLSSTICDALRKMEERPWPEWRQGKPITQTQLATALRAFSIRPGTVRLGATTGKGYGRKNFEDAWARYVPVAA